MSKNNDARLEIRLPEEELEQIRDNALACGKSVSAYVREATVNMCVLNIDNDCITKHTSEISSLRNAIYQLIFTVKKNGDYTPVDLEYILEKVNQMMKLEKEFLKNHSSFIESIKKSITRTVRRIVNKRITKQ